MIVGKVVGSVVSTRKNEKLIGNKFMIVEPVHHMKGDLSQIVAIDILSSSDDAAFFKRAQAVIDKIIEGQTLDVDTVSGATYSSRGIISAVKNALRGIEAEADRMRILGNY